MTTAENRLVRAERRLTRLMIVEIGAAFLALTGAALLAAACLQQL